MRRWVCWVALILGMSVPLGAWAAEETPFFIGEIYYPNAFIIFDNSDSMQDVPYTDPGGVPVRPNNQRWDYDVMEEDGDPHRDANGYLQWFQREDRAPDSRRASGGNHPASKLYQAKQALNQILNSVENVNLGFATYLSFRVPRVVARYYKIDTGYTIPGTTTTIYYPTRWQYLEWRSRVHSTSVRQPWPDHFTWYGTHYVSVGDQFTRRWTDRNVQRTMCELRPQNIIYTIDSVTEEYGSDGQFLGYRWRFHGGYHDYRYRTINDADYDPDCPASWTWNACDPSNLPLQIGSWHRVTSAGPQCRLWRKIPDTTTVRVYTGRTVPDIYRFTWYTTTGTWTAAEGDPKYIDPDTLEVTPRSTVGSWTLITSTLSDVTVGTQGTTRTVHPARYPADTFYYPAVGTPVANPNRPHAWSYVHRTNRWSWRDSDQPDPFFPADVGEEDANIVGDDHIIFVNLPPPDSNDTAMANRDKILQYVSLERYQDHPRYTDRDFTTMPYTRSVAPNTWAAGYWDLDEDGRYDSGEPRKATPLAASLRYAKRYYQSYIDQDTQSQIHCRNNYLVLLTDGLDTADCNPTEDYENCTAPIEAAAELKDLGVKTYVIGFGLEDWQRDNLDAIAEAGGTHRAYLATNVNELAEYLRGIFQEITQGNYTRSNPTISREGDKIYLSYFSYPGWSGHLEAWNVLDDGSIGSIVSAWGGSDPDNQGDAGGSLLGQGTRTIYTTAATGALPSRIKFTYSIPDQSISFSEGSLRDLKPLLLDSVNDLDGSDTDGDGVPDGDGNPNEDEDAEIVLQFTMNPGYADGVYRGTRNADWLFPDLYHTTPVVVGPPPFNIDWGYYPDFKSLWSSRDTLIYVGGNGGMIHAINESDGTERWAFIPRMALSNLANMRIEHTFFVDAKPAIADIYSEGGAGTVFSAPPADQPEQGWHTVLISGMRDGGKGYFALDITDPDDPKVLWELTDSNMGYTWSVPAFGRIRVRIRGRVEEKWVAFVGGGYSTNANEGNRLYIIDIEKGEILTDGARVAEYVIDTDTGDGDLTNNNVPSPIREVDLDKNGYVERIYFGDTEGILWKLDLSSTNMADWVPCRLLDPGTYDFNTMDSPPEVTPTRRPIYHQPAVALGQSGNYFVFFGTGDEHAPNAVDTQDFFYEVEDTGTRSGSDCTGTVNWVYVLGQPDSTRAGEKVLARPSVFNYVVYFTTYVPSQECGVGTAYLYGLTMSRGVNSEGGGEAGLMFGPQGETLSPPQERREIGPGVPSAPIVTNGTIYLTTSNRIGRQAAGGGIVTQTINPLGGQIRGWREVY
jgi:hypothetical protein